MPHRPHLTRLHFHLLPPCVSDFAAKSVFLESSTVSHCKRICCCPPALFSFFRVFSLFLILTHLLRTYIADISSYLISPNGNNGGSNSNSKKFQHATLDYFAIPNLVPKGPRANADVGQPHDASLKLGQDGDLRSGSWFCAAGGWPSLKQRTTTEIFYVIKGQGCLTDLDGMRHYFGPGDTVILPKGWSGRWDVLEDIHKVWFVHDHPNIEVTAQPIRVQIANYHTFAPQYMVSSGIRADAIHGSPSTASKVLYDVGPTEVGIWTCTSGSFPVINRQNTECCHVLEGVFFLTNAEDNTSRRCGPGDTVILPKGWSGYWDVIEPVKKLWCVV